MKNLGLIHVATIMVLLVLPQFASSLSCDCFVQDDCMGSYPACPGGFMQNFSVGTPAECDPFAIGGGNPGSPCDPNCQAQGGWGMSGAIQSCSLTPR